MKKKIYKWKMKIIMVIFNIGKFFIKNINLQIFLILIYQYQKIFLQLHQNQMKENIIKFSNHNITLYQVMKCI